MKPENIGSLGAIIAYQRRMNAELAELAERRKLVWPVRETLPNGEPKKVTVQDIFDYHLNKDYCQCCTSRRPWECRIHPSQTL